MVARCVDVRMAQGVRDEKEKNAEVAFVAIHDAQTPNYSRFFASFNAANTRSAMYLRSTPASMFLSG